MKELVHQTWFPTRADTERAVFESIEVVENRSRHHSTGGYVATAVSKPDNSDTPSTNRGEFHNHDPTELIPFFSCREECPRGSW